MANCFYEPENNLKGIMISVMRVFAVIALLPISIELVDLLNYRRWLNDAAFIAPSLVAIHYILKTSVITFRLRAQ